MKTKAIKKIISTVEISLMLCGLGWPNICRISAKVTELLNNALNEQENVDGTGTI